LIDRYQAQDRIPIVIAEGISGDLLANYRTTQVQREETAAARARTYEADNQDITTLQQAPNAPAPACFLIPCTCPDCEAAAQQFEEEDRLEDKRVQDVQQALRPSRARCPWCQSVQSPNDRNALKREVDTTGATIKDVCHICYNTKEKLSLCCCKYLQSICLTCADELNFVTPQHPHDQNSPGSNIQK
jgi:hypothetical protein